MRKLLTVLFCLCMTTAAWAFSGEPDGFGGLQWGDRSAAGIAGATLQDQRYGSHNNLTSDWYAAVAARTYFGPVEMAGPFYGFDPQWGLWDVVMNSTGNLTAAEQTDFHNWLIKTYGAPDVETTFRPVLGAQAAAWSWVGKTATLRVVMTTPVFVEMTSAQLLDKVLAADTARRASGKPVAQPSANP